MLLPTDDQDLLRAACRELLADQASSRRLRAVLASPTGHDPDLWKHAVEMGWTALALPESLGGLDGGLPDLAVLVEECGRTLMPSAVTAVSGAAWALARHASPELAEDLLPSVARGSAVIVWSQREPGGTGAVSAGAPVAGLALHGIRRHVADAEVATHLLLDADSADGPLLAVVDADAAGLTRRTEHTLDLTRRYQEVTLDGVAVPAEAVLRGPAIAELTRAGVVLQCAESVGVAARALEMTVAHVVARTQFGRPIGSFQAVKHRVADMHIELEGARVATRDAAEAVEAGRPDATYAVHVAASWTGRAASAITSQAVQLHGGIGFTWEHDLHLLQRRAKANELLLGTPSWHDERITGLIEAEG
jgi:alkylation response protein AidB-like acyl-CoA dehydrogenase